MSGKISGDTTVPVTSNLFVPGIDMTRPLGQQNVKVQIPSLWQFPTPQQFGAAGNGTTDDTAAFSAAIASVTRGGGGGMVFVPMPASSYLISSTLTIPTNVSLVGDPAKPTITTAAATFKLFSITGSDTTIENLTIQNSAKTGGVDFSIDVGTGQINRTHITNILAWNSFGCVADSGSGNGTYVSTWLTQIQARLLRGHGFNLMRSLAFLTVDGCLAEFIGSSSPNYTGFVLDNTTLSGSGLPVGGATFRNCDVGGTSTGTGANTIQAGFQFTNTAEVWCIDCDADTCDRYGWNLSSVNHLHMANCEASLCNDFGMIFSNCAFMELAACRVYGRNAVTGASGAHGFAFATGCADGNLVGCNAIYCTGNGFEAATGNIGPINISGGQARSNGGYGISTLGTFAVLGVGMMLTGNAAGNYSMAGTFQYLQASQLNNGTVVSVGPGPVSG